MAKFDPAEVLRNHRGAQDHRDVLVPSMLYALMDHPDSHPRPVVAGDGVLRRSAMNPVRLAEAIARFGQIFAQNHGQSVEAPMAISYLAKKRPRREAAVVVRAADAVRAARCWGTDDKPAAGRGRRGLRVRAAAEGGYWKLPEETAKTYCDGWLHRRHGPRGRGRFRFIVDRVKDVIVTGRIQRVSPGGGKTLAEHPSVAQVWWGAPDEKWARGDRGRGAAFRRCPMRSRCSG